MHYTKDAVGARKVRSVWKYIFDGCFAFRTKQEK